VTDRLVQAVDRSAVRGQGQRHRGDLNEPARSRGRGLCRGEDGGLGPGPHPTGPAVAARHPPKRISHDHKRHGTINLYAALNLATGVITHQLTLPATELSKFQSPSTLIDRNVPAGLAVHVVSDNSSTHQTPSIQRWLVRHPRFEFHFPPPARHR
jgi:hypothetical protein